MRNGIRCLAVLAAIALLLSAAQASGFSFSSVPEQSFSSIPAYLFDLETAQALKNPPAFQASREGERLVLTALTDLPDGSTAAFSTAEGPDVSMEFRGRILTVQNPLEVSRLTVSWTQGDAAMAVQYLVRAEGRCELWNASADNGDYYIIRKGDSNTYSLSCKLENVSSTTLYYDADGRLMSSILLGDRRGNAGLPLILQYNAYGCAISITAADLQHTYTYSRPQGAWFDEAGQPVQDERLAVFDPVLHPAPTARELTIGAIHLSEKNAGIDRAALVAAAPTLNDLTVAEGTVSFVSDADSAALTLNGDIYFSTAQGTLQRDGTVFTAETPDIYADSRTEISLERGGMTAVYQALALTKLTESAAGITLTSDGTLTYERGAVAAQYNARSNLTEERIHSADGAVLTYNRQGKLIGWAMDEYSWTREGGWRTTAVNEKGNIIHPPVKQPAAVDLKNYPAITMED